MSEELSKRDIHLNEVIGVKTDMEEPITDVVEVSDNETALVDTASEKEILKRELTKNVEELDKVLDNAKKVHDQAVDTCNDFSKSRDIEAFSDLTGKLTDIIKVKADINMKRFKPEVEKADNADGKYTQNNFYVGNDYRDLNDAIRKGKKFEVIDAEIDD